MNANFHAIDHLAVSAELVVDGQLAEVHRPDGPRGHLSDHAASTAAIRLDAPVAAAR